METTSNQPAPRWQPKTGRNTKLTPELIYTLAAHIASGQYFQTACEMCGVSKVSGYNWLRKAEEIQDRLGENEPSTDEERLFLYFLYAYTSASAESTARSVMEIRLAGKSDWRAHAWFLERTKPDLFGSVQRHVHEFGNLSDDELIAEATRLFGRGFAEATSQAAGQPRTTDTDPDDLGRQ